MTHPESEILSAYLDGDLGPDQIRKVEDHLSGCASCTALFRDLQEVQERARSLPDRFPDRDLWPQIIRSIRGRTGETEVIELHPRRVEDPLSRRSSGFKLSYLQAAAAVLALALFSGATGAFLTGSPATPAPAGTEESSAWLAMVEQASPTLDAPAREVARLEELLASNRSELDPATVLILEKNLGVIDHAIRECILALEADPGNRFLEDHLAEAVEHKASYLREATAFVAPVS